MQYSKGSVLDLTELISILFSLSIIMLLVYHVLGELETQAPSHDMNATYFTQGKQAVKNIDTMMPFVLMGLALFIIVSSSMIQTHPALFPFSLVLLVIVLVIWMIMGNAYYEISRTADLIASTNALTITTTIWDNILLFGIGIGAMVLIALYMKYKASAGGTAYGDY